MEDPTRSADSSPGHSQTPTIIALELGGDLPCARCRYNLRGLSVRSICPECGTPVRGTILAVVDPDASELRPIHAPKLSSVLVALWGVAGLLSALAVLALRVVEYLGASGVDRADPGQLRMLPAAFTLLSALGALALIRPHAGIPAWQTGVAAVGVLAYLPLAWIQWRLHTALDALHPTPYVASELTDPQRPFLRVCATLCIGVVILGLRPSGRLLVSRSLVMRTGRVDRQTLLLVLAAAGIAAAGDGLHLLAHALGDSRSDIIRLVGTLIIGAGSMLVLLGLFGVAIDCLRLRYAIVTPPLSLADVLGPDFAHAVHGPALPADSRPSPGT